MTRHRSAVSRLLRGEPVRLRTGLLLVVVGGAVYGAAMGSFGDRLPQVAFSAIKVPLLLGATTLLALPSFFVLNALVGLRDDFAPSVRAVIGTQAAVAVILAALAPYTLLWYRTTGDYHQATLFNGLMFLTASLSAQWVLRRRYATLIARNRRHRAMLWAWVAVYSFVGIHTGWLLRPFVGDPARPAVFLRTDSWGNAYEIIADMLEKEWKALAE